MAYRFDLTENRLACGCSASPSSSLTPSTTARRSIAGAFVRFGPHEMPDYAHCFSWEHCDSSLDLSRSWDSRPEFGKECSATSLVVERFGSHSGPVPLISLTRFGQWSGMEHAEMSFTFRSLHCGGQWELASKAGHGTSRSRLPADSKPRTFALIPHPTVHELSSHRSQLTDQLPEEPNFL